VCVFVFVCVKDHMRVLPQATVEQLYIDYPLWRGRGGV
jgi:hypothetical protein